MSDVKIQMFGMFRVLGDGRELPLPPSVKEVLALLTIAGGSKVTAKSLWKVLYKYKGIKYSSIFFSDRIDDLRSELTYFQIADIINSSHQLTRSCRLNKNSISCDYYEMLDGNLPLGDMADFLPEYEWAGGFYQKDWNALYQYWNSLN